MTPGRPTSYAWPLLLICSSIALSGCGLFESAGEVSFGAGSVPNVVLEFELPGHEQFLQEQRAFRNGGDGVPDGVSIQQATLAHVLGMISLSGQCERSFTKPGKKDLGAASDLVSKFIACPASGVCDHLCGSHRGVLLHFDVEVLAMTEKTTKELNAKVSQRTKNTLVGLRLRFDELLPYARVDGKRVSMLPNIHQLSAMVSDEKGNELNVLRDIHVKLIKQGRQPRATFAPDAPFTKSLIDKMEANKAVTFRLRAKVLITPGAAYQWPVFNSGFRLTVQPEFVVFVLGSVTG